MNIRVSWPDLAVLMSSEAPTAPWTVTSPSGKHNSNSSCGFTESEKHTTIHETHHISDTHSVTHTHTHLLWAQTHRLILWFRPAPHISSPSPAVLVSHSCKYTTHKTSTSAVNKPTRVLCELCVNSPGLLHPALQTHVTRRFFHLQSGRAALISTQSLSEVCGVLDRKTAGRRETRRALGVTQSTTFWNTWRNRNSVILQLFVSFQTYSTKAHIYRSILRSVNVCVYPGMWQLDGRSVRYPDRQHTSPLSYLIPPWSDEEYCDASAPSRAARTLHDHPQTQRHTRKFYYSAYKNMF